MATYSEITNYIKNKHNINVKTCWIAHVKELNGLIDKNDNRQYPCPNELIPIIEEAFKNFGMI